MKALVVVADAPEGASPRAPAEFVLAWWRGVARRPAAPAAHAACPASAPCRLTAGVLEYSLTQATLEQVFLALASGGGGATSGSDGGLHSTA